MEGPLTFAFLKDRYDRELARKQELTSALTLPAGVLSGLGGLIAVMTRTFSYRGTHLTSTFLVTVSVDGVAFVACLVYLALVYHRQKYRYLPLLDELELSRAEFEAYYLNDVERAEEEFTAQVRRRIIEAADINTERNDEKSKYLYWARTMLFAVLVLTAVAGATFVIDQVRYPVPRTSDQAPSQNTPSQGTPSQQTPSGPPPQVPPNREIREGGSAPERTNRGGR